MWIRDKASRNAIAVATLVGMAYGLPAGHLLLNPYRDAEKIWLSPDRYPEAVKQITDWPAYLASKARESRLMNISYGFTFLTMPIYAAFACGLRTGRKIEAAQGADRIDEADEAGSSVSSEPSKRPQ